MSTIKTETLSTPSNATVPVDTVVNGTAKAWVNFNGTGTVAIRRAFNVSSITDGGTGDYTVTFTNAMPDANYSICGQASLGANGTDPRIFGAAGSDPTASLFEVATTKNDGIQEDCHYVCVTIFS